MQIRSLWATPVFETDDQARLARLLRFVLWSQPFIVAITLAVQSVLLPGTALRWSIMAAAIAGSCIAALLLNRLGHTRAAGAFLVTCIWLVATVNALTEGGIWSPGLGAYICIVLTAGLLLGERAGIITAIFSVLAGLTLVILEKQGWLPAPSIRHTSLSVWCTNIMFIGIAIAVQRLAVKSVTDALDKARSELDERRRAEQELRESEERFRNLTQAAFEGICISEQGRVLDVNDEVLKMFGYTRNEMIGCKIVDMVAPESRQEVADAIRTGKEVVYVHRLLRKDGSTFFAEAQAKMAVAGNRVLRMTALRDITQRKEAEEALRKSEEKFSKAFRASPDGMAISELETGRYIDVNDGYCRLYGHTCEQMLGRTSVELGLWDDPRDREQFIRGIQRDGFVRDFEVRTRTRTDELRIVLLSGEPIELGGEQCVVTVLHDITERILAIQALRDSEARFRILTEAAFEGLVISEGARIVDVNDQCLKMFGFERREVIGRNMLDMIAPESQPMAAAAIRNNREATYELNLLRKDGTTFYGEARAKMTMTGDRAVRMTAVRDMTERRRAEQALHDSERRFRAIFNSTYELIGLLSPEGILLEVNQTALDLVGSRREEVVGKPFWETRWWNHSPELQEKLRAGVRFAAHGHVYRSEAEHPAADGRWRTVEFSLKPVMDTAGKVVMVIPEGHDITERKEFARNLLSAQERERKRLASELHDSLGQNLAVIKNHADTALQGAELPGPLAAHLQGIQRVAAEAIAETRNLAHNLRPPHIEQIGITESLRGLIHSVSQSTPVHFEFRLENVDDIFKGEAATNIYRIAQEALNNLVRHSRANQGSVTLERDVRSVRLRVVDDGVGFDSGNAASQNGLGLTSINERAHMLYGSLSIASTPGQGTELVVELPIPEDVAIVPET